MRRSLIVVASIFVIGTVWWVGTMPKQARAQETPAIVRSLPAVAPLEIKDSKLPAELVSAIKKYVGQGIPDVRGGKLRTAKVVQVPNYPGMPDRADVIGWVMPADENGVQMVVTLFGAVHRIASPGEPINVDEAFNKSYDTDQYMVEMSRMMLDRSLCKIVMLVISGETEKAEQFFEQMKAANPAVQSSVNGSNTNFESLLGQIFFNSNFSTVTRLARDTDWKNALTAAIRSKYCEEHSANNQGRVYGGYGFGQVKTDQIILDLERRIKENRPVPKIIDIVALEPEARRKALIKALDGSVNLDAQEPNLTLAGLITEEGEAIIPDLIEAYRTDDRVSFVTNEFGFPNNMPQPVRNLIYRYISQLWVGMPALPYNSMEGRYDRSADYWSAKWKEHSKLSGGQRYLNSIADMKNSDRSASSSLMGLFAKGTGGSQVTYVPGRVPIVMDQLTDSERKKLSDALEKRIVRFGDPIEKNPDFEAVGQLCIGLAHVKGKGSIPVLRQFSLEVLAKLSSANDNNWSQYGGALGAVISQRIALGDENAALIDYKAALENYSIKNVLSQDALRTGWEHPNNAAVQELVASALSRAISKLKSEGGNEVSRSYLMLNNFHRQQWFGSLGIRKVVADMVSDNTELGTIKTTSRDAYVQVEYTYPNGRGSTSYSKEVGNLVVGKEMSLFAGDLSIMQIDNGLKDMKFILATPEEARKSFRADFAKKLRDKGFDWKAHLENRYYGGNELPIYRP
ncbi:MAG: hypothetical protein KF824_05025 [Fimbriimonadaceae bacterium]|nr:MAG: hypothetical protein KF824_05025 [Fimbriimonadaceae bacterium]